MSTPAPRALGLKVAVTAAVAAVILGLMVGVMSLQKDLLGHLFRTGSPWVGAAFAVGALVGRQTRPWTGRAAATTAAITAAVAAVASLTLANGIYYGVDYALVNEFGQPQTWTVIGVIVGVPFGIGGSAWGRSWSSTGATLSVGVLAAVVMAEPIGWQLSGDRSFFPTTTALLMLIGLALPFLMLPRDRRVQGALLAVGLLIPVVLIIARIFR